MKIGIDIEDIERFSKYDTSDSTKIFSQREQNYCKSFSDSKIHFAGLWCAKESVIKAFEDKSISLNSIEILHKDNGAPYVNLNEELLSRLQKNNLTKIEISISHTKDCAIAICLIV